MRNWVLFFLLARWRPSTSTLDSTIAFFGVFLFAAKVISEFRRKD